MNARKELRHHRVPEGAVENLAAGHGGPEAIEWLVAFQYSRHVLLVRGVVGQASREGRADASRIRAAFDLLADVQREHPGVVDDVLRHPAVGAWALAALTGQADPGALAGVAAAAAVRAGVPGTIDVPVEDGLLMLPSVGGAALPASARTAEVRIGRGVEVVAEGTRVVLPADPHADAPGWQGLRRLTAGQARPLRLLLDDLDPYRLPGNVVRGRLGDAEAARWRQALHDAWLLLCRHHAATAAEIGAMIRVLTPLPAGDPGLRSATHPGVFGCTALSDPVDGLMLASTLAHEVQHTKLAALMSAVPLVRQDDTRTFYAPWRDDPRPLGGLLQGSYAYLGVSGFWRRQRHHEQGEAAVAAHAEFARWRDAALEATGTLLGSGGLTRQGETFAERMRRTLLAWRDDRVPDAAVSLARSSAERHRMHWRRHHGDQNRPGAPGTP
ncbi:HEXXH motif domain-containing protein [Spirillospora sp. NPDC047279]|uniref:HEXXH motif domain-containing protein n=1 Tax=Spirillospora sp. NPDC047279 TaxID=3155478 RepID=UPI0033E1E189